MTHVSEYAGKDWDANQYSRFAPFRRRPALDLLRAIPIENPKVIYDLGCGTGKITALLAETWPTAQVVGIDRSDQMLARARTIETRVEWRSANISDWHPDTEPDLIFANASLHWLPDHRLLFPQLLSFLKPGGCLAIQMPLSWHATSHVLMRETLVDASAHPLGTKALRDALAQNWVADAPAYYHMLGKEAREIDIWETTYYQPLEGEDPVYHWVRGAGLRPVLKGLSPEELDLFIPEYKRRLREAYPQNEAGITIYPFTRLFMLVTGQ